MVTRVAVCLSGCGFQDGAEIQESVYTLLALDQAGAQADCCAPDIEQAKVANHLDGTSPAGEKRSVLVESARIARGSIRKITTVKLDEIDALIFPGGFGAALNLCTFGSEGVDCSVDSDVQNLVKSVLQAGKPIGAICIAPALIARIAGQLNLHPQLTIGDDSSTASALEKMGARHLNCLPGECVVDETHKIVSTPAYMYDSTPAVVYEGIRKLVAEVIRLASA